MDKKKNKKESGFTLYELLITVLIVGLILSLGIPNFRSFNQNSKMTAAANDLHSSFHLARKEALSRKNIVTICASADSMSADPTCSDQFADGWVVFVDINGDIDFDSEDIMLRQTPAAPDDISIDTPGGEHFFSFAATGSGRGMVNGDTPVSTALICDSRGNVKAAGGRSSARALIVTPLGRPTILSDVDMIQNQITLTGGDCP